MKTGLGSRARAVVAVLSVIFLSRAEAASAASAITLRPAAGRVWQTCLQPSKPIKWPWIDGATAARLTVNSPCEGKAYAYAVVRADGDRYGMQALPANRCPGSERLFDLVLEYLNGETVLATETARVAVIPGVAGGTIDLRDPAASSWADSPYRHPMFAYDASWADAGDAAVSLRQSIGGAGATVRDLDGTSGYDVADAPGGATTELSLLHDGVEAFAGVCRHVGRGVLLIFR